MAASFIKKSNGNYYLRLTGSTTSVKFAATSKAGNTYTFNVSTSANTDTMVSPVTVTKPNNDLKEFYEYILSYYDESGNPVYGWALIGSAECTFYTTSANPTPAPSSTSFPGYPGPYSTTINDDTRFPGTEVSRTFSGSGDRAYLLSFSASPTPGTTFYLGGESLSWGSNLYAYPGSGYLTKAIAVGVKQGGSWKNSGNIYVKDSGEWKEVKTAWIKTGGNWKKYFESYNNSSWINMLEGTDDAIDFAVQVIALN